MEAPTQRILALAAATAVLVAVISNMSWADSDTREEKKDAPKVEPFEHTA